MQSPVVYSYNNEIMLVELYCGKIDNNDIFDALIGTIIDTTANYPPVV